MGTMSDLGVVVFSGGAIVVLTMLCLVYARFSDHRLNKKHRSDTAKVGLSSRSRSD